MKKYFIIFAVFALLSHGVQASALTAEELRGRITSKENEMKELRKEIEIYQNALEKQERKSNTLNNEIAKLNARIKKIGADIAWTERLVDKTELTIDKLAIEIRRKERSIQNGEATLAELLRALNETDEQSLIEVMFKFEKIMDFFQNVEQSQKVNESIQAKLALLHSEHVALKDKIAQKNEEKESLAEYREGLAGKKYAEQSVKNEKARLLKSSKNREDVYQKNISERERKRVLIQNEIAAIEQDLQALIDPSKLPDKVKGVLSWPVDSHYITQGFGQTEFARTKGAGIYKGKGHNGVDFRAAIGDRVLAAASGIVKGTGNTDLICPGGSYGKWVNIEHGNNLSTVYGHLSKILVKRGEKVSRGQLIAYSGASGYVTGPHLHLTLYASDTYRLAKTKHCGFVPAGGFLNPMDYLQ